jgi:hypothetical protein
MKVKKVTKIWKGRFVSVRCYEIDAAIKKNGLEIIYQDQSMSLSIDQLKTLQNTQYQTVKGRISGKDYKLFDVVWKPLAKDKRQGELI